MASKLRKVPHRILIQRKVKNQPFVNIELKFVNIELKFVNIELKFGMETKFGPEFKK